MARLMVVDDEKGIREALVQVFEYDGHQVRAAEDGPDALLTAESFHPDVIFLDVKMPGMDGLDVLARLHTECPGALVVMISGHGTIETAIAATRAGAYDFLEKPLDTDRLLVTLGRALELKGLTDSIADLKSQVESRYEIIGTSYQVRQVLDRVERVAPTEARVLVTGENGTGKELVARALHRLSSRSDKAFVEVNCATLKGDSAMSALFGHKKGAFTGAVQDRPGLLKSADKGLLFLDEIGELGLDEQAMILRAIEEGRFLPVGADSEAKSEFQLIAGTNRNLMDEVAAGNFREDLFARLNLWTFALPSLAERREDIEPNLDYELERFAEREGTRVTFNKEARERYLAFAESPSARWQGNFRDLAASVTRMATLCPTGRIDREAVDFETGRLGRLWSGDKAEILVLTDLLGKDRVEAIDPFDRVQLEYVVDVCRRSASLSDAGRTLFAASREQRTSTNDSDRLRKYLAKFGLDWGAVTQ